MGGFLEGLGQVAEGAMRGFEFAENVKDKIATRKEKTNKDAIKKQTKEAYKNGKTFYMDEAPIQSPVPKQFNQQPTINAPMANSPSMGAVDFIYNNNDADVQVTALKNGGMVRKYAGGGLVNMAADPEALSYRTNNAEGTAGLSMMQPAAQQSQPMEQPAQAAQPQNRKIDYGRTESARLNAARDKAMELGDYDLAKDYQDLGFKTRDDMFKKGLPMAQQVFAQTGDIGGYVKLYNNTHDDGYTVENHTKNADGTYALTMRQPDGSAQDMQMTADEMKQMVYQMSDPAARYAGEMAALTEREKERFKTDEKIREENAKGYTLNQGDKRFVAGKLEADNPKADGGLSDLLDVQKAAENPADPNYDIANKILARQKTEKIETAVAMRPPRAPATPREPSFERMAYEDWVSEPANKGKGRNQYLREKANWSQSEQLDSVTSSTERYDGEGNVIKESRTSKVKPQKPNSPKYQEYLDARKAAKGNDAIIKKIDAIARSNKVIK